MLYRISLGAAAVVAALCLTIVDSKAWDDSKYPGFSGQWRPIGGPGRFDMSKPAGRGQQAPLTAEYQAPWTVIKNYQRNPNPRPQWTEENCSENNHIVLGKEDYMLSSDGLLMPTRKDQVPPDLRYFKTRSP
jgi:hypothetical protein